MSVYPHPGKLHVRGKELTQKQSETTKRYLSLGEKGSRIIGEFTILEFTKGPLGIGEKRTTQIGIGKESAVHDSSMAPFQENVTTQHG